MLYIISSSINHALAANMRDLLTYYDVDLSSYLTLIDNSLLMMPNNHIDHITKNDRKEMDNYCFYAIEAIESLNLKSIDKEATGVYFGSCFGGLYTTEMDLKKLYKGGLNPRAIDPRLSLKMFYASTCSQVSMKYGITGPCLLFSEGFFIRCGYPLPNVRRLHQQLYKYMFNSSSALLYIFDSSCFSLPLTLFQNVCTRFSLICGFF